MSYVRIRVPATITNFGPGFDIFGVAVRLYNIVELEERNKGLRIEIEGEGADSLPRDRGNLVYLAAQKLWRIVKYRPKGLRIKLKNSIPLMKGLGSSAAAIVGGLLAANSLSGERLSKGELIHLATKLEGHPDNVAPALLGGFVVCIPVGQKIETLRLNWPRGLKIIAVIPEFQVSTLKAREILPEKVPLKDVVFNIGRASLFTASFQERRKWRLLGLAMEDKVHQPYRRSLIPGMEDIFWRARAEGALGVALSGSGPTIVALSLEERKAAIGRAMQREFFKQGYRSEALELRVEEMGARVLRRS